MFSEIPGVLLAGYLGLKYIPDWCCPVYEHLLWGACPPLILAEGFSALTVILSAGQVWSDLLVDSSTSAKVLVALLCAVGYGVALSTIVGLYWSGKIITVMSASLVATLLTLLVILTIMTVIKEHGTITDITLLAIYATYNLWLVSRHHGRIVLRSEGSTLYWPLSWLEKLWPSLSPSLSSSSPSSSSSSPSSAFSSFSFPSSHSLPSTSSLFASWRTVKGLFRSTLDMFSVEMMASLLIQMCLFILLARLYRRASRINGEGERGKDVANFGTAAWLIGVAWPTLGRAAMIIIYTYSWLYNISSATGASLSFYLDPITWRWINIVFCLLIYTWHLVFGGNEDEGYYEVSHGKVGRLHVD